MSDKVYQQDPNYQSHSSHYNAALNKCFMTTESMRVTESGRQVISRFLLDAFEQREYAAWVWISSKDKPAWDVPMQCELVPSSDDMRSCKTEDEYKTFVARYME